MALAALLLAGCGAQDRINPFAPSVESSQSRALVQVAKSSKPKHNNGRAQGRTLNGGTSTGSTSGGVTSGSFGDPGTEKPAEGFIID